MTKKFAKRLRQLAAGCIGASPLLALAVLGLWIGSYYRWNVIALDVGHHGWYARTGLGVIDFTVASYEERHFFYDHWGHGQWDQERIDVDHQQGQFSFSRSVLMDNKTRIAVYHNLRLPFWLITLSSCGISIGIWMAEKKWLRQ